MSVRARVECLCAWVRMRGCGWSCDVWVCWHPRRVVPSSAQQLLIFVQERDLQPLQTHSAINDNAGRDAVLQALG